MSNSVESTTEWQKPKEVTDLEVAFPVESTIKRLCPSEKDVPKEFFKSSNTWNRLVSCIFYGSKDETEFRLRSDDINFEDLRRHIVAILNSFAPSHEYKIASCAYLMSQWCVLEEE